MHKTQCPIQLFFFQILLWLLCCPRELPEVPSCRRRNFPERFDGFEFSDEEDEDDDENKKNDGKVDPALGLGAAGSGAKMMGNSLATDGKDKNF